MWNAVDRIKTESTWLNQIFGSRRSDYQSVTRPSCWSQCKSRKFGDPDTARRDSRIKSELWKRQTKLAIISADFGWPDVIIRQAIAVTQLPYSSPMPIGLVSCLVRLLGELLGELCSWVLLSSDPDDQLLYTQQTPNDDQPFVDFEVSRALPGLPAGFVSNDVENLLIMAFWKGSQWVLLESLGVSGNLSMNFPWSLSSWIFYLNLM